MTNANLQLQCFKPHSENRPIRTQPLQSPTDTLLYTHWILDGKTHTHESRQDRCLRAHSWESGKSVTTTHTCLTSLKRERERDRQLWWYTPPQAHDHTPPHSSSQWEHDRTSRYVFFSLEQSVMPFRLHHRGPRGGSRPPQDTKKLKGLISGTDISDWWGETVVACSRGLWEIRALTLHGHGARWETERVRGVDQNTSWWIKPLRGRQGTKNPSL